jgi:hypothetical protein
MTKQVKEKLQRKSHPLKTYSSKDFNLQKRASNISKTFYLSKTNIPFIGQRNSQQKTSKNRNTGGTRRF